MGSDIIQSTIKNINSRNAIVRGADERNAVNAPIQGTAADIIKVAMIRIQEELKARQTKTKMLLQVHDELVFDVCPDEKDTVAKLAKFQMENAVKTTVPLEVEGAYGATWLEAH